MVERRKHKRYRMPRGTFFILRNELEPLRNYAKMSIGEIAMVLYKSERQVMGQVKHMSIGGIDFDGDHSSVSDASDIELDLLMTDKGIYLHNIPFATVPAVSSGRGKRRTAAIRPNALCFKNLNAKQKTQIRDLLTHHIGHSPIRTRPK